MEQQVPPLLPVRLKDRSATFSAIDRPRFFQSARTLSMTEHPNHGTEFDSPNEPSGEAEVERSVPESGRRSDRCLDRPRIGAYRLSLRIG